MRILIVSTLCSLIVAPCYANDLLIKSIADFTINQSQKRLLSKNIYGSNSYYYNNNTLHNIRVNYQMQSRNLLYKNLDQSLERLKQY